MLEKLHRPADEVAWEQAMESGSAGRMRYALRGEAPKPPKHVHAWRWLCWTGMILAVGLFAGSDVVANWLEARGRGQAIDPVTATGWVRKGIKTTWYALPLVLIFAAWFLYHMIVQAFVPGLPL